MFELTPKIIAILRKYMRDPHAFANAATTLEDLDIDALDLPMISLDIEDAFGVQISYDDERQAFATVGDLVACVAAGIEDLKKPRQRTAPARPKRGWMSA